MKNISFIHKYTEDGLKLQGTYWDVNEKDICVVFIHGMSGNIIENYFAQTIGDKFSSNKIGFLFGHNRGYNNINDIRTKEQNKNNGFKTKRIGGTYEIFSESTYDVDLWVNTAIKLGYKRIILMGFSLGCNKSIYYLYKKNNKKIVGLILASPPDMVGLGKLHKYQEDYEDLLKEAKNNVESGNPRKILSNKIWDWYNLSSQTFLDFFQDNKDIDNIPINRNPEHFEQLESIKIPILAFMGEHDDIEINNLKDDLELIKKKATECDNFQTFILKGATHTYDAREKELANKLFDWISKNF